MFRRLEGEFLRIWLTSFSVLPLQCNPIPPHPIFAPWGLGAPPMATQLVSRWHLIRYSRRCDPCLAWLLQWRSQIMSQNKDNLKTPLLTKTWCHMRNWDEKEKNKEECCEIRLWVDRTLWSSGAFEVFEVRRTSYSLVNIWDESFFCSPPNYHFSEASASGRRLISWLFLKDGFEEIKGPQKEMERELNCGNFLFGGMKVKIHLGSVTANRVCSALPSFLSENKSSCQDANI